MRRKDHIINPSTLKRLGVLQTQPSPSCIPWGPSTPWRTGCPAQIQVSGPPFINDSHFTPQSQKSLLNATKDHRERHTPPCSRPVLSLGGVSDPSHRTPSTFPLFTKLLWKNRVCVLRSSLRQDVVCVPTVALSMSRGPLHFCNWS